MKRIKTDDNSPFQRISRASYLTGLSQLYIRKGCIDGTIPHVKCGSTYLVNVPALLRQLGVTQE